MSHGVRRTAVLVCYRSRTSRRSSHDAERDTPRLVARRSKGCPGVGVALTARRQRPGNERCCCVGRVGPGPPDRRSSRGGGGGGRSGGRVGTDGGFTVPREGSSSTTGWEGSAGFSNESFDNRRRRRTVSGTATDTNADTNAATGRRRSKRRSIVVESSIQDVPPRDHSRGASQLAPHPRVILLRQSSPYTTLARLE